jgi:hydroxymethylpyrimidine/phosphomethylpyrimidine kinase
MTKNLVSIAGYDPSGGAGVLLDIGVFENLGHRGFGVLTAVTAQSPERVDRVFPVAARAVTAQFARLAGTAAVAGIKVGMLATAENLAAAARILAGNAPVPRIVDPVFRSSSGTVLLEKAAWAGFLAALRGKADLITPNLDEAGMLEGAPVRTVPDMRSAAQAISRSARMPCLLKGGHLDGPAVDLLYDGKTFTAFEHERQAKSVHGTGCYLSSAILAFMADGRPLEEACALGIARVGRAIRVAVPAAGGRWTFDLNRERGRARSTGRKRR